jgi:hypothetical protein
VLTAILVIALCANCAQIPVTSEIHSQDLSVSDPGNIYFGAPGPLQDASPREIVNGFISAQAAGLTDNFTVAREYLTVAAARSWDPNTDTTVYQGDIDLGYIDSSAPEEPAIVPEIDLEGAIRIDVVASAKSLGTVDAQGTYTESLADARLEASFELLRNSQGQWRISGLRDGLVMSHTRFQNNYRAVPLYFLSPNAQFLVPDTRWVVSALAESQALRALIEGPSPWLRDSVRTAVPDGTRLVSAVRTGANVTVNLSRNVLNANPSERANLAAQVQTTLKRIPGVNTVTIQAESIDMNITYNDSIMRDPNRATGNASDPYVLHDDILMRLRGRELEPVTEIAPFTGYDVTALAIPESVVAGVFRNGLSEIRRLPLAANMSPAIGTPGAGDADGESADTPENESDDAGSASNDNDPTDGESGEATTPETSQEPTVTSVILSGNALIAPSVDRFTWVWSGEQRQSLETGELMLSSSYGTLQTTVVVPWLAGREVHSLRVSPDGTRVAVVSSANGIAHIEVAGIVRDAMNAPLSLGDPVTVGGQITGANAVAWQDESTLWVIGHTANNEAESLFGVSISGPSEVIAPAENTHTLTAARGPRAVILGSDQGVIRTRGSSGASWSEESLDAWFPTYPG